MISLSSSKSTTIDLGGTTQTVANVLNTMNGNGGTLNVRGGTLQLVGGSTYANYTVLSGLNLSAGATLSAASQSLVLGSDTGGYAVSKNSLLEGTTTVADLQLVGGTTSLGRTGKLNLAANGAGIQVSSGATLLLGSSGAVTPRSALSMTDGTVSLAAAASGITQSFGTLTLTGNSVIDFASLGGSTLQFSDIITTWINDGAGSLSVYGFNSSSDRFLVDNLNLSASELSSISFYSDAGNSLLGNGSSFINSAIVPVPETGTVVAGVLLLGFLLVANRRGLTAALARLS